MNNKSLWKLRTHLLILLILILIPISGLLIFRGYEDRQQIMTQTQNQARRLIRLFIHEQTHITDNTRQLLEILSHVPAVRNLELEECNRLLKNIHHYNPQYSTIVAANADGFIECCAIPLKKPIDVRDRSWFGRILETRAFVIDHFLISRSADKASLPFAYPVFDDSGNLRAAVGAAFDLSYYKRIFDEVSLPPDSVVIITDREGNVLYLSPASKTETQIGQPLARLRGFSVPEHSEGSFTVTDADNVERIYRFEHISAKQPGNETCLFVGFSKAVIFGKANRLMLLNISVLSLVALLSSAIAWIFGGKFIVEPVSLLVQKIRRISEGDLNVAENISYPTQEIDLLSRAFDAMAQSLSLKEAENRRAEEALRQREIFFRSLIEHIPQRIFVKDKNSVYLSCNRNFACDIGYEPEQIVGKDDFAFFPPEMADGFRTDDRAVISERTTKDIEEKYVTAGKERWAHTVKVPYHGEHGDIIGLIGIYEDITERRQAEEERRNLEAQLRQAQKMEAVGQLAGGVAHDFNNLLYVIIGYGDMMLGELPPGGHLHSNMKEIMNAAQRAATLVRQLLLFSRREAMQMKILNLNDLISELIKMLRRVIGEHIVLEFLPGFGLMSSYADPGQIEQILMNLCVNARDAMPGGGRIVIETENISLDAEYCRYHSWAKEGDYVLLKVSDTGCGIPAEIQDHIFEPFFTTKDVGKGTGLGLAAVYGIVRSHQGMIRVYSEPGQGAAFRIYLPAEESLRTSLNGEKESAVPVSGGKETVLVAEDEESVRTMIVHILQKAGYRVISAKDGEEAISLFEKNSSGIELALLDVIMPKMGGQNVLEKIRAIQPDIPIIFTTGYSRGVLNSQIFPDEDYDIVQKPVSPTALLRKIREVLDSRQGFRNSLPQDYS